MPNQRDTTCTGNGLSISNSVISWRRHTLTGKVCVTGSSEHVKPTKLRLMTHMETGVDVTRNVDCSFHMCHKYTKLRLFLLIYPSSSKLVYVSTMGRCIPHT